MTANSITVKALDIVNSAMTEIGALAGGESPSSNDLAAVLQKLQRLIDSMNARRPMVYNVNFTKFTMPANTSPVTIGPSGIFDVDQRPVDIDSIGLFLDSGSIPVELPLNKRDQQWWAAQTIKELTSSLPTDFYYSPDWPLGNIYFWPISTAQYNILLQSRTVLGEYTGFSQNFSLPPGYWDAIVYQLAVSICPMFERPASADLIGLRREAVKAIQVNNITSPRLSSDAPSGKGVNDARPDFSFLTGMP